MLTWAFLDPSIEAAITWQLLYRQKKISLVSERTTNVPEQACSIVGTADFHSLVLLQPGRLSGVQSATEARNSNPPHSSEEEFAQRNSATLFQVRQVCIQRKSLLQMPCCGNSKIRQAEAKSGVLAAQASPHIGTKICQDSPRPNARQILLLASSHRTIVRSRTDAFLYHLGQHTNQSLLSPASHERFEKGARQQEFLDRLRRAMVLCQSVVSLHKIALLTLHAKSHVPQNMERNVLVLRIRHRESDCPVHPRDALSLCCIGQRGMQ